MKQLQMNTIEKWMTPNLDILSIKVSSNSTCIKVTEAWSKLLLAYPILSAKVQQNTFDLQDPSLCDAVECSKPFNSLQDFTNLVTEDIVNLMDFKNNQQADSARLFFQETNDCLAIVFVVNHATADFISQILMFNELLRLLSNQPLKSYKFADLTKCEQFCKVPQNIENIAQKSAQLAIVQPKSPSKTNFTINRTLSLEQFHALRNNKYRIGTQALLTAANFVASRELIGDPTEGELLFNAAVSRRHLLGDEFALGNIFESIFVPIRQSKQDFLELAHSIHNYLKSSLDVDNTAFANIRNFIFGRSTTLPIATLYVSSLGKGPSVGIESLPVLESVLNFQQRNFNTVNIRNYVCYPFSSGFSLNVVCSGEHDPEIYQKIADRCVQLLTSI